MGRRTAAQRESERIRAAHKRAVETPEQREARLASHHASHEKHKERDLATSLSWKKRNPERAHELNRRSYERNRERKRAKDKLRFQTVRDEMIAAYGAKCACCGETEPAFLTLDHTEGRGAGAAHRRLLGNGNKSAGSWSVKFDLRERGWPKDGFRLLCWNCQWGTQREDGCPHQLRERAA